MYSNFSAEMTAACNGYSTLFLIDLCLIVFFCKLKIFLSTIQVDHHRYLLYRDLPFFGFAVADINVF